MTQITRKSVPMRGLILLLTVALGAGLVLSGCGDDDTATTPAPAPPPPPPPPAPEPEPEPEPPAPEAPATPTGLHVDDTSETSITWHWNAVEGAIGYLVQWSMDEMFDATDPTMPTAETEYTVSDLEPGVSVYLRVAAAAGTLEAPILSDWSTHFTGMSDRPPPPAEPTQDPVSVMFTIPDGEFPMEPDKEDDKETAMATVNNDITVTSSTTAIISADWLEDANGVSLDSGDNMPFAHVDWGALQAVVVSDGVTFKIQRTTVGAGQEMEPTGDVAYVTCGPFECVDGMDAPVPTIVDSAVCDGWNPMVELEVGFVNNQIDTDAATAGNQDVMDGVDIGWRTTSNVAMTVKHMFSGVANGQNMTVSGPDAGKGTSQALKLTSSSVGPNKYSPALIVDLGEDDTVGGTGVNADMLACAGDGTDEPYAGSTASALDMPEECFRVNTRGSTKTNYLGGYSIELSAKSSAVSWGSIAWKEFKDLTCDSMTYAAADHVDVCDLFADEAMAALDAGWAGSKGTSVTFSAVTGDNANPDWLEKFTFSVPSSAKSRRFATLWFNTAVDGKPTTDMYADADDTAAEHQFPMFTFKLLDADGDAKYGDFGKVDFAKRNPKDATPKDATDAGSWAAGQDGTAENADSTTDNKCTDDDNGDGCDAEFTEMVKVTLASGSALDCKEEVMLEITCKWDSDGEMGRYRADDHYVDSWDTSAAGNIFGDFVFSADSGDRARGRINAFASCTVK